MKEFTTESAAMNENFKKLHNGLQGGYKLKLSAETASLTTTAAASGKSYDIEASIVDANDVVQEWYNGKITLAVAKSSAVSGATATIDPVAGAHSAVKGKLSVKVTLSAVQWANSNTATLTVTAPIGGMDHAKTFVVTVVTG